MSTTKRTSYNALLRKIARLEAALAAAHEEQQRAHAKEGCTA